LLCPLCPHPSTHPPPPPLHTHTQRSPLWLRFLYPLCPDRFWATWTHVSWSPSSPLGTPTSNPPPPAGAYGEGEFTISVIIPFHNAEETLGTAVESVLASAGALYKERGERVELLLVDDASSDASSYFFFLELLLVETRPAMSCVRLCCCGRI
jgi:hypothetical protein